MEMVNCKIELANNKFILVNILAYNNFMWTKKGEIVDIVILIIENYYSLLKAHLAAQTCKEAVVQRFSIKKVFLEISQDLQEYTCAWVSFSK